MTEAEWLACTDPWPMLDHVRQGLKDTLFEYAHWMGLWKQTPRERKLRLFACASMRYVWDKLENATRNATEVAERYADGMATKKELALAGESYGVPAVIQPTLMFAADAALSSAHEAARIIGTNNLDDPRRLAALADLSGVAREIFGNPFRPVTVDTEWLAWNGGTVVKLSQVIYDDRAFDRLPLLADALEDAGCADAAVLEHLRGPGPHFRGCYVIDALLGKK
jgi:hypothetical protein